MPTSEVGAILAAGHAVDGVVDKDVVISSPRVAAWIISLVPIAARSPSPW